MASCSPLTSRGWFELQRMRDLRVDLGGAVAASRARPRRPRRGSSRSGSPRRRRRAALGFDRILARRPSPSRWDRSRTRSDPTGRSRPSGRRRSRSPRSGSAARATAPPPAVASAIAAAPSGDAARCRERAAQHESQRRRASIDPHRGPGLRHGAFRGAVGAVQIPRRLNRGRARDGERRVRRQQLRERR